MDTFADYILDEENLSSKMEIMYYLSKREHIFFDKSVVFKTELARLFLKYNELGLDENQVLTACLLCNCKKENNVRNIEDVKKYAKNGAEYLETLGFDKRFCKICEEVNRYSGSEPREKEGDVLELVDQFGGMILNRPERIGFKTDEAVILLVHRNLKNKNNRYKDTFAQFINMLDRIDVGDVTKIDALDRLKKTYRETNGVVEFMRRVTNQYEPQVDNFLDNKYEETKDEMFEHNRPLFTEETNEKVFNKIEERNKLVTDVERE